MTLEEKRIKVLYELMEEMMKQGREVEVSALRWTIFQLENQ